MHSHPWKVAGLASLLWALLLGPIGAQEPPKREHEFLPTRPTAGETKHPWLVADLGQVPEIQFQKVEPRREPVLAKDLNALTPEEQALLQKLRTETSQRIAESVGKVNKANEVAPDHFMKVLVLTRPDLAGLPWVMGDACRTNKDRSAALVREVLVVRSALRFPKGEVAPAASATKIDKLPWDRYDTLVENLNAKLPTTIKMEELPPARVAALMQILGPASANVREEMVKRIAKVKEVDGTHALARLAIFSAEEEVRKTALAALKDRNKEDYSLILLQGLRYPWPTVAKNASEALIALSCKDQVPTLVKLLDEPDARAPSAKG
jgi:hypothetical protein